MKRIGTRQLLNYTYHHAPAGLIYGWELGNELTHGDKATNLTGIVLAYQELRSVIDSIKNFDQSLTLYGETGSSN